VPLQKKAIDSFLPFIGACIAHSNDQSFQQQQQQQQLTSSSSARKEETVAHEQPIATFTRRSETVAH